MTMSNNNSNDIPVATAVPVYQHPGNQQEQPRVIFVEQPLSYVRFGGIPIELICPHCHTHVWTEVSTQISCLQHLWALGLCVIGCWPCAILPYLGFNRECGEHVHQCPNCHAYLGSSIGI